MSKFPTALLLIATAIVALGANSAKTASAEGKEWTVSFEEAKKLAKEQGKDIYMEFTGSDWCPPCKALHKNVLSQEAFLKEAPKNFILLKLDNPRDKSKQSEEEQAQYKKLAAEYKVSGVPSVFLADAEGQPYVKMVGYGGQDADAYVKQLAEKADIRQKRDEFLVKAKEAQGVEKAKLLDQALSQVGEELALERYGDMVKEIVKLDADDAAKLKSKYEAKFQTAEIKARLQSIQRSASDVDAALKEIAALIEELDPKGEALQEVLFTKGGMLFRSDKEASKAALEAAVKLAPESKLGKRIERIIEANFK